MASPPKPSKSVSRLLAFTYLGLSLLVVWAMGRSWGSVPPLGSFFSPFTGFLQQAEAFKQPKALQLPRELLHGKVSIELDSNQIPFISAQNNYDLYFAQGFVTARHRLWQMEFQTHAAAGRLSEIVGPKALEYDRFQRRFGMVWAAEKALDFVMADPASIEALTAYSDGVNAWINRLSAKNYPLEYKLLNYAPEAWKPIKTVLLLKYMAYTLTAHADDFYLSNIRHHFGDSVIAELFPNYPKGTDPIVPKGTKWDFKPVPIPNIPTEFTNAVKPNPAFQPHPDNGSNNWAVSGKYTQSGYPILANDPHLNLGLPSLWYQVQLKGPDQHCAGASLPGAPGIIIGFTPSMAWGLTNTGADVLDYYSISYKDASAQQYWYNNQWEKVTKRPETILVRGSESITDTVAYTIHGPVAYMVNEKPFKDDVPKGHAIRWLAHDAANEIKTFYLLNRAKNYSDFTEALKYYACPAQNFAYADSAGNIAMHSQGKFPLRWPAQGKFTLDGSAPNQVWTRFIPSEQNPKVLNPSRGFVSSANQSPTDSTYPYYLDWNFAGNERGRRINQILASHTTKGPIINTDSFRLMQTDNYSLHAATALPIMLAMIDTTQFNPNEKQAYSWLKKWDYRYNPQSVAAGIFEAWWTAFMEHLWQPHFGHGNYIFPSREITLGLLKSGKASRWTYNPETGKQPGFKAIIDSAFAETVISLPKPLEAKNTKLFWATKKGTGIQHLARLAPLSRNKLWVGGSKTAINALSNNHGPSWRMVVQTGKNAVGYGIYPGGQDGNPGGYYYDNLLPLWLDGKLLKMELK